MRYASGGDLHKHLQKDFASITWNEKKLRILHQISMGLETIHNKKFIHRDFHSGNILYNSSSEYGYSMMNKYEHYDWKIGDLGLSQAVNSKSSNNENLILHRKYLEGAIYTSRPLSALISKCSSTYSFSTISFDSNYISELENNKDTESLSLQNLNSNYISEELELDIDIERYISEELKLDINTERSQNLSSAIQNFSTSLKKRSNVEFLNVAPHNNSGKRIKTNFNYP
ncbi:hypothetical protein RhiirC2_800347 [Rhizophagus irregularis]|uniref:Protein kinase domain-containing protein n=1 Tax=Rhizophagus irregularis TaxID=588596 RepID=A0A2N1M3T5_9GLOM|nr:hypothetical protein RhiirC2_800347 [Rhizophagus irregularis]